MTRALDIESDAFGHALLDHLDGCAGHELIERSDGYIAVSAGTETYFAEPSDPLAIDVCRRRGLRDARLLSVEEVDASLGKFDTVLMLGHNLALLGSAGGAKRILKRLHRAVVPGGRLIGDILDPYETEDPNHLAYHAQNRSKGRMGGQIRMRVRYKGYKSPWFDYLFLSREELEGLLEATGWRLKEIIGTYGPSYAVHIERVGNS